MSETVEIENETQKITGNSPNTQSRKIVILNDNPVKFGVSNGINRHPILNRFANSFENQCNSFNKSDQDNKYKDYISISNFNDYYNHNNNQFKSIDLPYLFNSKSEPTFGQNILMATQENHNLMQIPNDLNEMLHSNLNSNSINSELIQLHGGKRIGSLTIEERRLKVEKFLQKKKNRTWNKKISYDCRKRVADSRLRIKGRFVTKKQAGELLTDDVSLTMNDFEKISKNEIKNKLNTKYNSRGSTGDNNNIKENSDSSNSADEDSENNNNTYNFNEDNNSHFHHDNTAEERKNFESNLQDDYTGIPINNIGGNLNTKNNNLIPSFYSNDNFQDNNGNIIGNYNDIKQNNNELYLLQEELSNHDVERDGKDYDKYQDINLDFKLHEDNIKFEADDYFQNNMSLNL